MLEMSSEAWGGARSGRAVLALYFLSVGKLWKVLHWVFSKGHSGFSVKNGL